MFEEYKNGYRDGFKDGFEQGQKQNKNVLDTYKLPTSPIPNTHNVGCYVCGRQGIDYYVCSHFNCPSRVTWTVG